MNHTASLILLVALFGSTYAGLSCKDENGKDVDWFMAIKIPKMPADSGEPFSTGFSYAYITSNDAKGKVQWKLGKVLVKDSKSIFGQTLEPLYSSPSKYSHVMYNDAPPHGFGKCAHSLFHGPQSNPFNRLQEKRVDTSLTLKVSSLLIPTLVSG